MINGSKVKLQARLSAARSGGIAVHANTGPHPGISAAASNVHLPIENGSLGTVIENNPEYYVVAYNGNLIRFKSEFFGQFNDVVRQLH